MRVLVCLLVVAVVASTQAVRPTAGKTENKSLEELKETLRTIRSNLLSLKTTFDAASGVVDAYESKPVDPVMGVEEAFNQLKEKNIPSRCMEEATFKLNEIKAAVLPNCSVLHIVEDAGAMSYNSLSFTGLTMVTLDDLLNGYQECRPWYIFWHYIPCVISYAFSRELTDMIREAVSTWSENEDRAKDVVYQVLCAASQTANTPSQVLNEAYLCARERNFN